MKYLFSFKSFLCIFSLWKDVTYFLKAKRIDRATAAKTFLEQRQREEAKERNEKSIKWQTKVILKDFDFISIQSFLLAFY